MKKIFFYTTILLASIMLSNCSKEKKADYSIIDSEKAKVKNALDLSQEFNDTLKLVIDTAKVKKHNRFCLMYDTLYHRSDSMFRIHYSLFGDEMYHNGMMMQNYTPADHMMGGGGMMGNASANGLDMHQLMSDTAEVGVYYRNMRTLHSNHQLLHNQIY